MLNLQNHRQCPAGGFLHFEGLARPAQDRRTAGGKPKTGRGRKFRRAVMPKVVPAHRLNAACRSNRSRVRIAQ
jgi:hypothetical protein